MKRVVLRIVTYCMWLSLPMQVMGHGFAGKMLVTSNRSGENIDQLSERVGSDTPLILSYNIDHSCETMQRAVLGGKSTSAHMVRIHFLNYADDSVIVCMPTQTLYDSYAKRWISAAELMCGTWLLARNNREIMVSEVEWISESTPVYTVEVENTHTFFIGKQELLTHNMMMPIWVKWHLHVHGLVVSWRVYWGRYQ